MHSHLQSVLRDTAIPQKCAVPISRLTWRAVIDPGWLSSQTAQPSAPFSSAATQAWPGRGKESTWNCANANVMAAFTFSPAHPVLPGSFALEG